MIVVCDPLCIGISHEKVNSGFLYAIRLAFPEEKIVFYAEQAHIEAIRNILQHDGINIPELEYRQVKFRLHDSLREFAEHYFQFRKILRVAAKEGGNRLFMLSFTPKILYLLKRFKQQHEFNQIKFNLVLHGDFETIATDTPETLLPPSGILAIPRQSISDRLKKASFAKMRTLSATAARNAFSKITSLGQIPLKYLNSFFSVADMLLWKSSPDFRYIALSPHVLENAKRYIDTGKVDIYPVVLPTVFAKPSPLPFHDQIKFAVFGYGNSAMLKAVAMELEKRAITSPYSIQIIGMDNSGLEQFPNITCPTPGKRLSRDEMEKYAEDVDVFLNLYDRTRYRLSCSGSILEALSYAKPIIHFENDCLEYFNSKERPIGICCVSIGQYADVMQDMINNYKSYVPKFAEFRKNMLAVREEVSIEKYVPAIQAGFTW